VFAGDKFCSSCFCAFQPWLAVFSAVLCLANLKLQIELLAIVPFVHCKLPVLCLVAMECFSNAAWVVFVAPSVQLRVSQSLA
jgi:hypothetical protein